MNDRIVKPDRKPDREPYRRNKSTDADGMSLPEGKTCSDCVHTRRCCNIFGHIPEDEVCDWAPSRYRERKAEIIVLKSFDLAAELAEIKKCENFGESFGWLKITFCRAARERVCITEEQVGSLFGAVWDRRRG